MSEEDFDRIEAVVADMRAIRTEPKIHVYFLEEVDVRPTLNLVR